MTRGNLNRINPEGNGGKERGSLRAALPASRRRVSYVIVALNRNLCQPEENAPLIRPEEGKMRAPLAKRAMPK